MSVATQNPSAPAFPSAAWLYDELMQHIEPELTSAELPLLPEKYKNETPEENRERMKRYAFAFCVLEDSIEDLTFLLDSEQELATAELDILYDFEKQHDIESASADAERAIDDFSSPDGDAA